MNDPNDLFTMAIIAACPKQYPNSSGVWTDIAWPKGKVIARCGDVFLLRQTKTKFAVVYGLEVTTDLTEYSAGANFGRSCIHQAGCHGMLD